MARPCLTKPSMGQLSSVSKTGGALQKRGWKECELEDGQQKDIRVWCSCCTHEIATAAAVCTGWSPLTFHHEWVKDPWGSTPLWQTNGNQQMLEEGMPFSSVVYPLINWPHSNKYSPTNALGKQTNKQKTLIKLSRLWKRRHERWRGLVEKMGASVREASEWGWGTETD